MTERGIPYRRLLRIQLRSPTHRLSDGVPDVLEEAIALGQTVQRIVALAHGPYESAEGIDVVLALDGAAVLVNLGDRDLNRGVVLGLDDAVRGAALARDVTVNVRVSPPSAGCRAIRREVFLQVDDLALVVLHCSGCCVVLLKERFGLRGMEERYRKFGWSVENVLGFCKIGILVRVTAGLSGLAGLVET